MGARGRAQRRSCSEVSNSPRPFELGVGTRSAAVSPLGMGPRPGVEGQHPGATDDKGQLLDGASQARDVLV